MRVRLWLAGERRIFVERENSAISVGDLTRLIKNSLENNLLLQSVWIEGEISNFRAPFSGHWYFTLKDANASLRCVMFKSRIRALQGMPTDGEKILIQGNISVYEKDGQYQCYVERWLPTGIGELAKAYEKLKEKFTNEGLFEASRKRELPFFPKRIGIITSETGAAIQDMVRVATRRNPTIQLSLFPVRVQGDEAGKEISQGIEIMDQMGFDALIVGRGGGSIEDLWAFNEEVVVRAIAAANTPIVSAVGHESDFTLADYVSDVRAATPSQGMEILIPEKESIYLYVRKEKVRLIQLMERKLHALALTYKPLQKEMQRIMEYYIGNCRQEVEKTLEKLKWSSNTYLEIRKKQWSQLYVTVSALDPYKNLIRGYSITETLSGKIITSISDVAEGEKVKIRLSQGEIEALVEKRSE